MSRLHHGNDIETERLGHKVLLRHHGALVGAVEMRPPSDAPPYTVSGALTDPDKVAHVLAANFRMRMMRSEPAPIGELAADAERQLGGYVGAWLSAAE